MCISYMQRLTLEHIYTDTVLCLSHIKQEKSNRPRGYTTQPTSYFFSLNNFKHSCVFTVKLEHHVWLLTHIFRHRCVFAEVRVLLPATGAEARLAAEIPTAV